MVTVMALGPHVSGGEGGESGSKARWVPIAWIVFLFISSFRFSGPRSVQAAVSGVASPENMAELAAYGVIGALAVIRLAFRTPRFHPVGVGLFASFAILAVASVLWSLTPLFTLTRAGQLLVVAALIAVSAGLWSDGSRSLERDWRQIWFSFLAISALFSLAALLWPNWHGARWSWPGLHTGTTSEYVALSAMVLLSMSVEQGWNPPRQLRRVLPLLFVVAIGLLLLTITRSSLFGFIVGAFAITWTGSKRRSDKRLLTLGAVIAVAAVGAAWFSQSLTEYLLRGQTADQFASLTGRTDLWSFAFQELNDAPILGFGYGAARVVLIEEFSWAGTGHNLWVEAALSLGLIGAALLTAVLGWIAVRGYGLQKSAPGPASNMGLGFIVATLVTGVASTAFALPGLNFATMGLVLAAVSVSRRHVTSNILTRTADTRSLEAAAP